mmetsp:Transcript_4714/g.17125  ORF Transcript_4714/g.17125 Transcript_4714/m.17125 type:complete len:693 (-) Transcript_4714:49-2127(-)
MDEELDVKKKKKKKVSGIHFDDTIVVSEKIIEDSSEELKERREVWHDIQERANSIDYGISDESPCVSPTLESNAEESKRQAISDATSKEISITAPPERESQNEQEKEDADQAFDLPSVSKSGASQNEKQEITRIPREEEVPSAGCPKLSLPSLNEFVSEKEKEELFNRLSRELLQYVSLWPEASKLSNQEQKPQAKQKSNSKPNTRQQPEDYQVPVKTRKLAEHFLAALKKWLSRTWQKGMIFNNTYHIGILMEKDLDTLRRGRDPIFATKLETVWNGDGFEVKSVPILEIEEGDWLNLAQKFKTKHITGNNFFPSESYQAKLDINELIGKNDVSNQEFQSLSIQAEYEEDTDVGISVQFQPRTSQINLNTDVDGRFFTDTADMRRERILRPFSSEPILSVSKTFEDSQNFARFGRSNSFNKGSVFSKYTSSKPTKSLALDKPFMEFARVYTGCSRPSMRILEQCKQPYIQYTENQKRTQALLAFQSILKTVESSYPDEPFVEVVDSDLTVQKENHIDTDRQEKIREAKEQFSQVTRSFEQSQRSKDLLQQGLNHDDSSAFKANTVEFLRRPLQRVIQRDSNLLKSLQICAKVLDEHHNSKRIYAGRSWDNPFHKGADLLYVNQAPLPGIKLSKSSLTSPKQEFSNVRNRKGPKRLTMTFNGSDFEHSKDISVPQSPYSYKVQFPKFKALKM